ncbi:MAG TPA: hypothetical protein DCK95_08960 [Anaerolineaceae bacterium]|nr:hypothetical protein [Anaerolineaceae bacterium]
MKNAGPFTHSFFKLVCLTILCTGFLPGCSLIPSTSGLVSGNGDNNPQPVGTIFFDDFSLNTSGWDRLETDLGGTDYMNGGYHILIEEPNTDYFSTLYRTYENISLQVDALRVEGPTDNNYGLICRFQDEKNFYAGMISSDGYYGLFKIENGQYTVLGHENMLLSDVLSQIGVVHTLKLDCYQDFLFLYVDGNLLDVQQDQTFTSGDVGLIAGSFEKAGVHIQFDNFYLIDPEAAQTQENQE